jgi:predicted DNA-binding transcriptional regulator YafY
MTLVTYMNRIIAIDRLIRKRQTGTPKDLAVKLGVSERTIYEDIEHMRQELGCPITYCRSAQSYCYEQDGHLDKGFVMEP